MRTLNYMSGVFLLLSVTAMAQTASAPAPLMRGGGAGAGNGGDPYASYFVSIARRAGDAMMMVCGKNPVTPECGFLRAYLAKVDSALVVPRDSVVGPDQKSRLVCNDGDNLIQLGLDLWKPIQASPADPEGKVRLVIHEYLTLAKAETSDRYTVSDPWIALMKSNLFSMAAIAGVPEPTETRTFSGAELEFDVGGTLYPAQSYFKDFAKDAAFRFCKHNHYTGLVSYKIDPNKYVVGVHFDEDGEMMPIKDDLELPPLTEVTCSGYQDPATANEVIFHEKDLIVESKGELFGLRDGGFPDMEKGGHYSAGERNSIRWCHSRGFAKLVSFDSSTEINIQTVMIAEDGTAERFWHDFDTKDGVLLVGHLNRIVCARK